MAQTKTVSEPRRNLTLETLPLNYSNLDLTLSFYFNCTTNLFSEPPIDCLRFKEKQSYVIVVITHFFRLFPKSHFPLSSIIIIIK